MLPPVLRLALRLRRGSIVPGGGEATARLVGTASSGNGVVGQHKLGNLPLGLGDLAR
jgi:hypothetical protein